MMRAKCASRHLTFGSKVGTSEQKTVCHPVQYQLSVTHCPDVELLPDPCDCINVACREYTRVRLVHRGGDVADSGRQLQLLLLLLLRLLLDPPQEETRHKRPNHEHLILSTVQGESEISCLQTYTAHFSVSSTVGASGDINTNILTCDSSSMSRGLLFPPKSPSLCHSPFLHEKIPTVLEPSMSHANTRF